MSNTTNKSPLRCALMKRPESPPRTRSLRTTPLPLTLQNLGAFVVAHAHDSINGSPMSYNASPRDVDYTSPRDNDLMGGPLIVRPENLVKMIKLKKKPSLRNFSMEVLFPPVPKVRDSDSDTENVDFVPPPFFDLSGRSAAASSKNLEGVEPKVALNLGESEVMHALKKQPSPKNVSMEVLFPPASKVRYSDSDMENGGFQDPIPLPPPFFELSGRTSSKNLEGVEPKVTHAGCDDDGEEDINTRSGLIASDIISDKIASSTVLEKEQQHDSGSSTNPRGNRSLQVLLEFEDMIPRSPILRGGGPSSPKGSILKGAAKSNLKSVKMESDWGNDQPKRFERLTSEDSSMKSAQAGASQQPSAQAERKSMAPSKKTMSLNNARAGPTKDKDAINAKKEKAKQILLPREMSESTEVALLQSIRRRVTWYNRQTAYVAVLLLILLSCVLWTVSVCIYVCMHVFVRVYVYVYMSVSMYLCWGPHRAGPVSIDLNIFVTTLFVHGTLNPGT
jgi:hypothetical protein